MRVELTFLLQLIDFIDHPIGGARRSFDFLIDPLIELIPNPAIR